jgi:phycoerythrin-associated linker protein
LRQQYQVRQSFEDTAPIEFWGKHSEAEAEIVIRAVYRQVLGNTHVLESDRLRSAESLLKQGKMTVRNFVRWVAKSALYRSRFFDNCYPLRTVELNFKHLLGRAPEDYSELVEHSILLNTKGFEAEIDSYIDSAEYTSAFGDNVVPFCRGYQSLPGMKLMGFPNMIQLVWSASSSDVDPKSGNRPRLMHSLISNTPWQQRRNGSRFTPQTYYGATSPPSVSQHHGSAAPAEDEHDLWQQSKEQEAEIASLQRQLTELRPFANMGASITRQGQFASAAVVETQFSAIAPLTQSVSALQQKIDAQTAQINDLRQQLAEARSLSMVAESRLNKWRQKTFF